MTETAECTVKVVEETPTFAIVELLGHVKLAGRLSEEEKFGSKLGRLDVPDGDGFRTVYFGGQSVYRIQLVTEAVARHVAKTAGHLPVASWDFPAMLPAAEPKRELDAWEDDPEIPPADRVQDEEEEDYDEPTF